MGRTFKNEKQAAFFRATQAGAVREIALNNGGTGDLRKGITQEEFDKRKKKRKIAQATRKANRK
ncbi:hypothetical protein [Halobacillus sp. BBL2006]|uniref:hypothetical protein n=1 Tax=Halobacillus sp. BBL2006 TaxID=1543706 RepID=UPI000541EAFA|nr:hypothetical protein [Halobacillus sp. BBL2006]KHE70698.1 hypothetical protein LD39_11275 [Halobacillus sp. BBL2006]